MLKAGLQVETQKLSVMAKALQGVEKEQDMMLKMVPPERMEVDGTPMPDADLMINY